jgi:lysophospholipase L1-like esterase
MQSSLTEYLNKETIMRVKEKVNFGYSELCEHGPINIVAFGDSVTHGVFELVVDQDDSYREVYRPNESYPARLGKKLNQLFPAAAVTVLNAGIGGDNARGGLARIDRDVLYFKPDLVIVNFALNDSMSRDIEAGIKAYERNMRQIFEKILASGAEAMLVTPNFMCSYVSSRVEGEGLLKTAAQAVKVQNDGILARYAATARTIAAELNIPVADSYRRWEMLHAAGVDTTDLLCNGINHPTPEMHDIFVEEILRTAL